MKEFYINYTNGNVSYRNKVTCHYVKVERDSIVCYINNLVVGVFPASNTIVTSSDLNAKSFDLIN